jgi:hypothetical protein
MSLAEIINELPKLTVEERQAIYLSIQALDGQPAVESTTPEMLAAINESIRSAAGELSYSPEELRHMMEEWLSDSK